MSAPGTTLRFDVTATRQAGGTFAIGCERFTLEELTNSAESVTVGRNGRTEVVGAVGTVGERDMVTFAGTGRRQFRERQVRSQARNLTVTAPQPVAAEVDLFTPGNVLEITRGRKTKLYVVGDDGDGPAVYRVKGDDGYDPDEWRADIEGEGWEVEVYSTATPTGKAATGQPVARSGNPDPATLRWQEGDQVEWVDGRVPSTGPRTRDSQGRWWRQNGHRRTAGRRWTWTDRLYDQKIAEGKVRIITKGGVHFS